MFQQQESTDTFFLLDSLSWCHLREVDLFVVESIKIIIKIFYIFFSPEELEGFTKLNSSTQPL